VGVVACCFGAIAPAFIQRYRRPPQAVAGIYGCFLLLLVLAVVPGAPAAREWIRQRIQVRVRAPVKLAFLILIWCLPYFAYAAGTQDFRWTALARLLVVAVPVPFLYRLLPVQDPRRFAWQDLAVAVWLAAVLLSHQLSGIWNVPANLDFMARLFLIGVASWCWVFERPVPELGYDFSFSAKTLTSAAQNFALFALIAIPSSLALRFTEWNPRRTTPLGFGASFLEIFLFVALLEELFFRGFLQTLLSASLRSTRNGQVLVSCLFGLFHILHAPFPNWRYVLLATVAGWFYGSAFLKSGNLMGSSLTHALVDTVWRTFLTKG
jgi:membrane protease YdiL (CAAX protease family)